HIKENLARGKREKLYRENINEDIISRIYLQIIDFIVNPHNFPATDYNFIDLYKEFISYHLQAIVTPAGYEYLKDIQLKDNE
ncbi:MAG: TetR/AcrR family transcriptional regulator, partial [Bacteroidetes bacterium]|nr:TetR/AcrR family transcriptional regulator [Bacteroidota bacterium]